MSTTTTTAAAWSPSEELSREAIVEISNTILGRADLGKRWFDAIKRGFYA